MNTCRICKKQESPSSSRKLFKYGTRHYAHADCGIGRLGVEFLNRLPQHMIGQLPYMVLAKTGLLTEAENRISKSREKE